MKRLQLTQLSTEMERYADIQGSMMPTGGWIAAVRSALNMSMRQLGERLGITVSGVQKLERNESEGRITIRSLKDVANAMDMQLVYFIVPKEGTLTDVYRRQAREKAKSIIGRIHQTMVLEDQQLSDQHIQQELNDLIDEYMLKMPRGLWD